MNVLAPSDFYDKIEGFFIEHGIDNDDLDGPDLVELITDIYREAIRGAIGPDPVGDMREELQQLFERHDLWHDARWYTAEEWKLRREHFGTGADLSLVFEGPLCHAMYYGDPDWFIHNAAKSIADKYGYRFEFGAHWSLHFYPRFRSL